MDPRAAESERPGEAAEAPVQFSIRGLLVFQAVVAIFLVLLARAGIFGLLVAWVATIVLLTVRVSPRRLRLKRLGIDILGGLVLPPLCLAFDPGLLATHRLAGLAYPAIGFQMLVLAAWLVVGPAHRGSSALAAGLLSVGALTAGIIGLLLLPLSLLGLLAMGIGLLGMTPFLTLYVFARNAVAAARHAAGLRWRTTIVALGVLLAVAIPLAVHATWGPPPVQWIQSVKHHGGPFDGIF